jgi:hypothetical protein
MANLSPSVDNEVVDMTSLSALTAAFTRLAVALESMCPLFYYTYFVPFTNDIILQLMSLFKHSQQCQHCQRHQSFGMTMEPFLLQKVYFLFHSLYCRFMFFLFAGVKGLASGGDTDADHAHNVGAEMGRRTIPLYGGVVSPVELTLRLADEPSAGRWYCVSQGRVPGVYSSW